MQVAKLAALVAMALLGGCSSSSYVREYYDNEFGACRVELMTKIGLQSDGTLGMLAPDEAPDRNYILDRMRLALAMLADGYSPEVGSPWDDVYVVLRRQGLNDNASVPAFFTTEAAATVWKGEPFEQALAYCYTAIHYGMQDSWDNVRAAIQNATFALTAIATDEEGKVLTTQEALVKTAEEDEEEVFKNAVEQESDFVYGYLMQGLCNQQLSIVTGDANRAAEARSAYEKAAQLDPAVRELSQHLASGSYNTVLVVDFARGPEKYGTGTDNVIAAFRPLQPSDPTSWISVRAGNDVQRYPQVCDVNQMSLDHRWNNREDMRKAKSTLGTALLVGGATVAMVGNNREASWVALGLILGGLFLKATSGADTAYCEFLPQRVYMVPLNLPDAETTVEITVPGSGSTPATAVRLHGLRAPPTRTAKVEYLRLLPLRTAEGRSPAYYMTPESHYGNEYAPHAARVCLPYILGGQDVRAPSVQALADYQRAGYLQGMTVDELEHLYIAEKIAWTMQDTRGLPGKHVLEGGHQQITPEPGSMGYLRLMCGDWPPYQPKSEDVQRLHASIWNSATTESEVTQ